MPIGDVLYKLGNGQQLSRAELEDLRLWGNKTELMNAFATGLQTGESDLHAKQIFAKDLIPDHLPSQTVSVGELSTQSIPDNTWTKVTIFEDAASFDSAFSTSGKSEYFEWDFTNQRFRVKRHGRKFILYTHVDWDDNDTGGRAVTIDTYLEDGTTFNGAFWMDVRQANWDSSSASQRYPLYWTTDPSNDFYYEMSLWQNSGGPLDILTADFLVGILE